MSPKYGAWYQQHDPARLRATCPVVVGFFSLLLMALFLYTMALSLSERMERKTEKRKEATAAGRAVSAIALL